MGRSSLYFGDTGAGVESSRRRHRKKPRMRTIWAKIFLPSATRKMSAFRAQRGRKNYRRKGIRPLPLLSRGKYRPKHPNHSTAGKGCQDFFGHLKMFLVSLKPGDFGGEGKKKRRGRGSVPPSLLKPQMPGAQKLRSEARLRVRATTKLKRNPTPSGTGGPSTKPSRITSTGAISLS